MPIEDPFDNRVDSQQYDHESAPQFQNEHELHVFTMLQSIFGVRHVLRPTGYSREPIDIIVDFNDFVLLVPCKATASSKTAVHSELVETNVRQALGFLRIFGKDESRLRAWSAIGVRDVTLTGKRVAIISVVDSKIPEVRSIECERSDLRLGLCVNISAGVLVLATLNNLPAIDFLELLRHIAEGKLGARIPTVGKEIRRIASQAVLHSGAPPELRWSVESPAYRKAVQVAMCAIGARSPCGVRYFAEGKAINIGLLKDGPYVDMSLADYAKIAVAVEVILHRARRGIAVYSRLVLDRSFVVLSASENFGHSVAQAAQLDDATKIFADTRQPVFVGVFDSTSRASMWTCLADNDKSYLSVLVRRLREQEIIVPKRPLLWSPTNRSKNVSPQ
jgi:hypothetical protein